MVVVSVVVDGFGIDVIYIRRRVLVLLEGSRVMLTGNAYPRPCLITIFLTCSAISWCPSAHS